MIVPAKTVHMTATQADALVKGDVWHIDSGLGGSWTLTFMGFEDGLWKWKRKARTDWPAEWWEFDNQDRMLKALFKLEPESKHW